MRSLARTDVPVAIADGDVEVRVLDQDGLMVGFVRLPAGADLRPATKGLPDDLCPCPHWGYMLKGRVRMHTTGGYHDFVSGEAFYCEPGHAPDAIEDSEYVDFSPTDAFQRVLDHLTGAAPTDGVIANAFYTSEYHGDHELISIGALDLEEGGHIPDCRLAVTTWGELNEARDNAILIPTWYSGTHQIWRTTYVGPEHALNPERYFIVAINQIGSGLSTSPHNADGANAEIAMSRFPRVRIGDDVVAQERLLREHFGIERLALVVEGSMGAQQTYEWAVRFPDKVLRAAPIAGTAQNTPHDYLVVNTLREALRSDPGWSGGEYASNADVVDGIKRQAHIWAVVGFSAEFWKQELWRALGFETREAFVAGFLEPYFTAMDPNDLLTQAWKSQHGDVTRYTGGDLAAALGRITAKTFVMPIDEDLLFPPPACSREQQLITGSELRVIEDPLGHLALFGVAPTYMPQIDRHLAELLDTAV